MKKIAKLNNDPEVVNDILRELKHELASPLTVIKQVSSSLKRDTNNQKIEQANLLISKNIEKIQLLTSHYLDPLIDTESYDSQPLDNDLSQNNIAKNSLDINSVMTEIIGDFKFLLKEEDILLEVFKSRDVDYSRVCIDQTRLYQALYNLVKNAFNHLVNIEQDIKKIKISFRVTSKDFLIEVEDNGHGLLDWQKNLIFKQSISTKADKKSHGIGLRLVKKYINASNGDVILDPSYSEGSRFIISLPIQKRVTSDVLVVDDLPGILDTLEYVLGDSHNITLCSSATHALESFQDSEFDIVVSDLEMPQINGVDLYHQLRESGFSGLFIFFTGYESSIVSHILKNDNRALLVNKPELNKLEEILSDAARMAAA